MKLRSKLFGNAAIYLGANILNAGIPFLLLPILTRVLTPADYGTVAMFGIVLSVIGAFTGLSVHGAISVRYFQLQKKELAEYISTCIGILVISTTLLFILVIVFGSKVALITGLPVNWVFAGVFVSGIQFLGNIRLTLWQVSGEAKKYGVFQITQSLLNTSISLILILMVGLAWKGRVLGQFMAIMLLGAVALWLLFRDGYLRSPSNWREHYRNALMFGIPLIPHTIGGLLMVATDRFIIIKLLDVAQAGIYMVALQLCQVLGLATESYNKSYAPWLMENLSKPTDIVNKNIVRHTYFYFALVIVCAAVLGLGAPLLVALLVGDSFRAAGEIVIYIAFGFAFGGCYYMVTNYIFYKSKTKILALVSIISGLLNIPLTFFLVQHNGIAGAAQAFMLTQAFSFLGTWWVAQKVHPMPWFYALSK